MLKKKQQQQQQTKKQKNSLLILFLNSTPLNTEDMYVMPISVIENFHN